MNTASTTQWRLKSGSAGFRLERIRAIGSEEFTWVQLFDYRLSTVQVFVLYFPSRFDLPVDAAATDALRIFGQNTPTKTSVNFWDPRDENFGDALLQFNLQSPPALVLAAGLLGPGDDALAPGESYSIAFTGEEILADRASIAAAVNTAHEILVRCDRREIISFIRHRKISSILAHAGTAAGVVRDQLLKLHPKFGLPGGISVELG